MAKGICFSLHTAGETTTTTQNFPSTLGLLYNKPSSSSNAKIVRDGLFGSDSSPEKEMEIIRRIHRRIEDSGLLELKGGNMKRKFDPERFSKRIFDMTMRDTNICTSHITTDVGNILELYNKDNEKI